VSGTAGKPLFELCESVFDSELKLVDELEEELVDAIEGIEDDMTMKIRNTLRGLV